MSQVVTCHVSYLRLWTVLMPGTERKVLLASAVLTPAGVAFIGQVLASANYVVLTIVLTSAS